MNLNIILESYISHLDMLIEKKLFSQVQDGWKPISDLRSIISSGFRDLEKHTPAETAYLLKERIRTFNSFANKNEHMFDFRYKEFLEVLEKYLNPLEREEVAKIEPKVEKIKRSAVIQ